MEYSKFQSAEDILYLHSISWDLFSDEDHLDFLANFRNNFLMDEEALNVFKSEETLCEKYFKIIKLFYDLVFRLIRTGNSEHDKQLFLSFYSRSHNSQYTTVEQFIVEGSEQLLYYDIPFILYLKNIAEENISISAVDAIALKLYRYAFYDRAEVLLNKAVFLSKFKGLKECIVELFLSSFDSVFSFDRFATLYRSIRDPFAIRSSLRDSCISAISSAESEARTIMIEKKNEFITTQLDVIFHDLELFVTGTNNVHSSKNITEFNNDIRIRNDAFWRFDTYSLVDCYVETVGQRCNLFAHGDEDSGFFGTLANGLSSIAISIFENASVEGRKQIKEDVFNRLKYQVENCFDRGVWVFHEFHRPMPRNENSGSNGSSGFCYITTAVCDFLNKPDDCYELQTLRWFRDNWIRNIKNGAIFIQEYYHTAPAIVNAIYTDPSSRYVYNWIYEQINIAIRHIEQSMFLLAFNTYFSMVNSLKIKYNIR